MSARDEFVIATDNRVPIRVRCEGSGAPGRLISGRGVMCLVCGRFPGHVGGLLIGHDRYDLTAREP